MEAQYQSRTPIVRLNKKGEIIDPHNRVEVPKSDYSHYAPPKHTNSFMAVRPWLGSIVEPSVIPPLSNEQPAQNLKIEHIYGYRSLDARSNVLYLNGGKEIVYMSASVVIIHNTTTNKQRFLGSGEKTTFKGHDDDITAIAISSDKTKLASGSLGKNPMICIWNLEDGSLAHSFRQGVDTKLVSGLSFSPDGKYLASVAGDDAHNVYLFDAATGTVIANNHVGTEAVTDLSFSHKSNEFATIGKNGIKFWHYDGKTLEGKRGIFGTHKITDLWSITWLPNGTCLTGGTTGSVYLWEGNSCSKEYKAHTGPVSGIIAVNDLIITSGRDNKVIIFDNKFVKKEEIEVRSNAKALDFDIPTNRIAAGLRDGTVIEIENSVVRILNQSHSDGELWGLALDTKTGYIVTTADDNKILVFDPKERKCIGEGIINEKAGPKPSSMGASTLSQFPPNQCARVVAVNPVNGHVAIGVNDGQLSIRAGVLELNTRIVDHHDAKEWIEATQYSPCGNFLAVGSHDNFVYVYDVNHNYKLISKFVKQNSFITSLDWSTDSNSIQSVSGSYEVLYSDAHNAHQFTEGGHKFKDEEWTTWSSKLGWPVQGIFPSGTDGSHINGVDRNNKKDLVATGDDWRLVNLHRWPALFGSTPKSYVGHSEHVVRVKFDSKDEYLYSIGGYDRTLIQWKIE